MKPIDMVLYCPNCGVQHIDMAEHVLIDRGPNSPPGNQKTWTNPPHRSHLCHNKKCNTIWRPADVPTNGVERITTEGKADTWKPGNRYVPAEPVCPECAGTGTIYAENGAGPWSCYACKGKRNPLVNEVIHLTDDTIDKALSTAIPGGSIADNWFLPHETKRGMQNVREVVRLMLVNVFTKK